MVAAAWGGAADADVVVLRVEAHRGVTQGVEEILVALATRIGDRPVALAINKIDRVEAPTLLGLSKDLNERFPFVRTFMISAEKGYGVDKLRQWLASVLPEGPWFYPEDQIADVPMRAIAAEITREKLTLRLHEELPYQLTVETEKWEDRDDGSTRIDRSQSAAVGIRPRSSTTCCSPERKARPRRIGMPIVLKYAGVTLRCTYQSCSIGPIQR